MVLKIKNDKELNTWMNERRLMCHDMSAIKGEPPKGATYSDGELIHRAVNVQWRDRVNGEVFDIDYGVTCEYCDGTGDVHSLDGETCIDSRTGEEK